MRPLKKAFLGYALLAVLLWSTVASAFKIALAGLTPLHLLLIASWTSVTVLLSVLILQRKMRALVYQTMTDWCFSAGLGVLYPLVYYLLLFGAYDRLPAQQAQPLNYSWPVLFVLLSVPFLGESLSQGSVLGLLVSFAGVVIVSTQGNPANLGDINLIGSLMALLSGLVWAFYWILNLKDQRDPLVKLTSGFLFGAAYITILAVLFPSPLFTSIPSLCGAVYVGLFEMGLTFVFWLKALEMGQQVALIGNLAYLSPFLSLVFIHFILGEEIHLSAIMGLTLIVCGIAIQTVTSRREH